MIHHENYEDPTARYWTEIDSQCRALEILVDTFAAEMKEKLFKKAEEGFRGWDDVGFQGNIEIAAHKHFQRAMKGEGQWVDLANLAAMLWNLERAVAHQRDEER